MRLADVQFRSHGLALIARVKGEVDLSNADEIGTTLVAAVSNQAVALVVDLSDVEHLDSAGIQLIYRLREDLRVRGQALRLVIPQPSAAHDALRLAAVFDHIQLVASVDDALAELAT